MNKLVKTLKEYNQNKTKTLKHSESGPCLLKFFNFSRELKVCDEEEIKTTFQNAFNENPKIAVKCLLYLRDTKAGHKEKKIYGVQWHPEWMVGSPAMKNLFDFFVEACL